jgi:SAM-dependent methyltransferase
MDCNELPSDRAVARPSAGATLVHSPVYGPITVRARECPLCGDRPEPEARAAAAGRYDYDIWRVVDCARCRFVFIDRAPVYNELSSNLAWEKTKQIEQARRATLRRAAFRISKKTRWRLHIFPRRKFPDLVARHADAGPVVDIGCGTGTQMLALAECYTPHGIEISATQAAMADRALAAKGGFCLHAPALEGLRTLPAGHFAAATLRSYLEHEERPLDVLKAVHRALRPGGVAIIKVPNYGSLNRRMTGRRWVGFRYPDHLNYFTPQSLSTMAERAGFPTPRYGLLDRFPTSDSLYAVLRRRAAGA